MNAQEKLSKLLSVLSSGKTVYISTYLRCTKITAKHIAKFEEIGRPLFKVSGNSLFMSVGKRYDCIDYCKVTME